MGRFFCDEQGSTASEYGLISALVAMVMVGGLVAVSESSYSMYKSVISGLHGEAVEMSEDEAAWVKASADASVSRYEVATLEEEKALKEKEEASLELVRERYLATEESTDYAEAKMASIKEAYASGDISEEEAMEASATLKESLKGTDAEVASDSVRLATKEASATSKEASLATTITSLDTETSKSAATTWTYTATTADETKTIEEAVMKTR